MYEIDCVVFLSREREGFIGDEETWVWRRKVEWSGWKG